MSKSAPKTSNIAINIADALELGIVKSDSGDDHKDVLRLTAGYAQKHLMKEQKLRSWHDVEERHIAKYVESLKAKGLAGSTIKNYVVPLRLASNATRWEFNAKPIDFNLIRLPDRENKPARFLTAPDAFRALKCIRRMPKKRRPFTALAAGFLGGLRLTEFNRLTPDKLIGDELEISGRTKNNPSARVIPIPQLLVQILKEWFEYGVEPVRDSRELGRRVRTALDDLAFYTGIEDYELVEPRDAGRKSWVQWASMLNVPERAAQAYMGHHMGNAMINRYYHFNSPPKPTQTAAQREQPMQKLRELVLAPIEKAIAESGFRLE